MKLVPPSPPSPPRCERNNHRNIFGCVLSLIGTTGVIFAKEPRRLGGVWLTVRRVRDVFPRWYGARVGPQRFRGGGGGLRRSEGAHRRRSVRLLAGGRGRGIRVERLLRQVRHGFSLQHARFGF